MSASAELVASSVPRKSPCFIPDPPKRTPTNLGFAA